MVVSDATIVGACYAFSVFVARLYVLQSADETHQYLSLDGQLVSRTIGKSVLLTLPVAGFAGGLNWIFAEEPQHALRVSPAAFLAVAWLASALGAIEHEARKQIRAASGVDVVARAGFRAACIGWALGVIASFVYLFGLRRWM